MTCRRTGCNNQLRVALETGRAGQEPLDQAGAFDEILHHQKRAYLAAFAQCGRHNQAARIARIHRTLHYHWLQTDDEYAEAFARAREMAADKFEDEATRRAIEGWLEPVYQQGTHVGDVRRYSDLLLIFRLKALRPEVYRERHDISGPGGGPVQIEAIRKLSDEELDALRADLQKRLDGHQG